MDVTLGHFFILMAFVELVVLWKMIGGMRAEDERKPEGERRPTGLIMAAAFLASAGLVAIALFHPVGEMPIL